MNRLWEEFIPRSTIATVSIATGALIVIAEQWALQGWEGGLPAVCQCWDFWMFHRLAVSC